MIDGNSVWLTISELTSHLSKEEALILVNNAIMGTKRKSLTSWISRPYITPKSKIQIDLDSIPQQTINKYRIPAKQYWIEKELNEKKASLEWNKKQVEAMRSGLFSAIAIDPEISAWYLTRLEGVQFASSDTWKKVNTDYPILCALMVKLTSLIDFTGRFTRNAKNIEMAKLHGFDYVASFVDHILENVFMCSTIKPDGAKELTARYHNFNISNQKKFLERVAPFAEWKKAVADGNYAEEVRLKQAALESLISKKFGVTNNSKRTEWHINQLIKLARFGNQPKSVTLKNNLNIEAKKRGYAQISYETLRLWLNDKTIYNRLMLAYEGRMKWMNNRMFVINTEGASAPDVLWFADGETVELYWWDGKALRRENYVVVMDDYSRKIIGWARGTESHDTTYRAVKNAIEHKRTVAWQFKTDKGPGFKGTLIEDFFDSVFAGGYGHTPATTGLARAKAIEPMFARFREQVLAQYVNHSFGNITSAGPQANPEFVKAHLHEFPTNVEQLDNQWMEAMAIWNERAHEQGKNAGKTPDELYDEEYDERKYVSELWMTEKFWMTKPKPSTYEAHGLKITWAKQDYLYLAPVPVRTNTSEEDLQKVAQFLNENAGRKFDVKFDPDNLDRVALYFNGTFMCYAYSKIKTKRAFFDTTADDSQILRQYWKIQELQEEDIKDFNSANDHYAEAEGLAKVPMVLTSKKQRQDAETAVKTIHMRTEEEVVAKPKYAGMKKWE
jgi:hypothetical protein